MNNKQNFLTRSFAIIFVILLSLPGLGYFFHFTPGKELFGYTEIHTAKPEKLLTGWFDKQLQPHLEEVVNQDLGFRAWIIRRYNDVFFRLFAQHPRQDIFSTKEHGLYFGLSVAHLNNEYINREELSKTYNELALKLAEIQSLLTAKGKHFEVIIAGSKPYVYLDGVGKRFLLDDNLHEKALRLGSVLKEHGVNVIDSAPILREVNKNKGIETHARSGVHWNYYAGCVIAKQLFTEMRTTFANAPTLHCGTPTYKAVELIDKDGYLLMNVKGRVNLIGKTAYPTPVASISNDYLPKMLIVGDSFMHQIITSLDQAKAYSNITVSSYYRTNINHKPGELLLYQDPDPIDQVEKGVLNAVLESDIVILEMVDYNIPRMGYGFAEALLKRLKEET
ncbi:hypothetical protein BN59_00241 [Legionella massiliensis]|uniref:AlgX/AlgJ SGNH hydrolase-like domain-containing protein n=1 Tax=Legionella massiliensis TaxID=1034943 RepID=A0A078KSP1_9GAMM|nr:hypothetical protein [Legionella massiliensis]CDZ75977.1 hypothetical protein BN59_00241 [Legionella massiliensis]CEE11715.1 hypothetical protein BN1094_00241 [Legionella massiliensis]